MGLYLERNGEAELGGKRVLLIIGSPPTGGAGRMKLFCHACPHHTQLTRLNIWKKDGPPQCVSTVSVF